MSMVLDGVVFRRPWKDEWTQHWQFRERISSQITANIEAIEVTMQCYNSLLMLHATHHHIYTHTNP